MTQNVFQRRFGQLHFSPPAIKHALLRWLWRGKFKAMQGSEAWKHTPQAWADTTAPATLQISASIMARHLGVFLSKNCGFCVIRQLQDLALGTGFLSLYIHLVLWEPHHLSVLPSFQAENWNSCYALYAFNYTVIIN